MLTFGTGPAPAPPPTSPAVRVQECITAVYQRAKALSARLPEVRMPVATRDELQAAQDAFAAEHDGAFALMSAGSIPDADAVEKAADRYVLACRRAATVRALVRLAQIDAQLKACEPLHRQRKETEGLIDGALMSSFDEPSMLAAFHAEGLLP